MATEEKKQPEDIKLTESQTDQKPQALELKKPSRLPFLIIALLLILIVPLGGYFLMTEANKAKDASEPRPTKQEKTFNLTSDTPTPTPQNKQSFLEIPEYGVKIPLSKDISDAYYQMKNGYAYFSVHSLDSEPECAPLKTSIAAMSKVGKDEIDQRSGEKYSTSMSGTTIGNYFYFIDPAQAACTQNAQKLTIANAARKAFTDASKTITSL